jgi:hypothetical protein
MTSIPFYLPPPLFVILSVIQDLIWPVCYQTSFLTHSEAGRSGNLVGPLLLPGAIPNPACPSSIEQDFKDGFCYRVTQQQQPEQSCRLQLLHGPITAGTIPNEDKAFTTCVDPVSPPKAVSIQRVKSAGKIRKTVMVEAPGTAPGSALLISQYVYRHSQQKLTSDSIAANCVF